ncbi:MAG: MMPL family transporter [Verrucomicrobiales bacterium]|nr:MMPL family transporter [Verrucomicrobiales bacterium]
MQSFLERWRTPYLLLIAALSAFFAYQCLHLRVDQDNRSMNADNEAQLLIEKEFHERFQTKDTILVAIHKNGILDPDGRDLIQEISFDLQAIDGVEGVISLADHNYSSSPPFESLLISKDRNTAGIPILLADFSDHGESLAHIIQEIQAVAASHENKQVQCYITGLPFQKYEAGRLILKDQKLFAPLSFLVLGLVLWLVTRQLSGLIFPLLISATSIIWTLGIYSICGYSLNMITSLLPPVIMTLSVTTTIHIYLEWLKSSVAGDRQRIITAIENLYLPCLFATLTTAIGFLSLLSSDTPAVRQFGIFAALGVIISYFIGVSGLAVGLSYLKVPVSCTPIHTGLLDSSLRKIADFTIQHPHKIITTTILVAVLSLYEAQKVRSNTDLLKFLGSKNQLYQDSTFIDQNLTGVNQLELLISKNDHTPFDRLEDLEKISSFQKSLEHLKHVQHSFSVIDLLSIHGSSLDDLPSQAPLTETLSQFELKPFFDQDSQTTRLSIRITAIGSSTGTQLIEQIHALAQQHLDSAFEIKEAGGFYRMITESDHLVATQIKSFAIALTFILVTIGIIFRSILFMGLAIIPNIIPLLMGAAIMGFASIDLSTGTVMIASVIIGIAVDDTIHYLSAFKKSFKNDCDTAIKDTTQSTGYALSSTTLALSLGFWVAILGSFQPTIYFALLSGMSMWFALTCDLLVLPACIKLSFCSKKK